MDADEWVTRVADVLGVPAPGPDEVEVLLSMASTAAHTAERWVAPVTCALAAASDLTLDEARAAVEGLAGGPA